MKNCPRLGKVFSQLDRDFVPFIFVTGVWFSAYMIYSGMVVELPEKLALELEAFRRRKGQVWADELLSLIQEQTWNEQISEASPASELLTEEEANELAVSLVRRARGQA